MYLSFLRNSKVQLATVISGAAAGLLLTTISNNPYLLAYSPMLLAGGIVFYLLKDSTVSNSGETRAIPNSVIYLSFFTIFTVLLYLWAPGSLRTQPIFIVTYLLYLPSILCIYSGKRPLVVIPLIITTGIVHRATMFYGSSFILGVDPLFHLRIAGEIASVGTLEPLADANSKYYYAPVFHTLVATGEQLLNLSTRGTSFFVITIPFTVITGLGTYLITNHIFEKRIASIALLLYTSMDASLGWSVMPQTTTLGITFFPLVLFLFLNQELNKDFRFYAIAVGLFVVILFTHQVSAFVTTVSLTLLAVSWVSYEN